MHVNNPQPHQDPQKTELEQRLERFLSKAESHTAPKPRGSSRRPYYNALSAQWVRSLLLQLAEDGKTIAIPRGEYSVNSMRMKWYDGVKYLQEQTPQDELLPMLQRVACRATDDGLEIYRRRNPRPAASLSSHTPLPMGHKWKDDFTIFIETEQAINSKFHRQDVALSEQDIAWGNALMEDYKDLFLYKFAAGEVLIIRVDKKALGL